MTKSRQCSQVEKPKRGHIRWCLYGVSVTLLAEGEGSDGQAGRHSETPSQQQKETDKGREIKGKCWIRSSTAALQAQELMEMMGRNCKTQSWFVRLGKQRFPNRAGPMQIWTLRVQQAKTFSGLNQTASQPGAGEVGTKSASYPRSYWRLMTSGRGNSSFHQ